jgi:hypothetical protein
MAEKNCLIKVSGDMISERVLQWIKNLSKKYSVVVCVGGSTQINKAFEKAGFPVSKFGPLGRESKSLKEKKLAKDILEKNKIELQNRLKIIGARVKVVIPFFEIGKVLCHINGDNFVLLAYLGFDILYVVTTKERVDKKKEFFAPYPKVKVIGFDL